MIEGDDNFFYDLLTEFGIEYDSIEDSMYYIAKDTINAQPLHLDACRQLWAAVLEQAVSDACVDLKPLPKTLMSRYEREARARIKDSAIWWVNSPATKINSFIGICHNLGLDPQAVREKVLKKAK